MEFQGRQTPDLLRAYVDDVERFDDHTGAGAPVPHEAVASPALAADACSRPARWAAAASLARHAKHLAAGPRAQ